MTTSGTAELREIGWNGVRFNTPSDWEVGKIGNRYLLLENNYGPVMEVKWGRIRGKFSPQKQFNSLRDAQGKAVADDLKQASLPESWETSLRPFEAAGFAWRRGSKGGRGVVLRCPECRNVTLLQFFDSPRKIAQNRINGVLSSYRDHPGGDGMLWSLFDIRAMLPASFRLNHYRFESGVFELGFDAPGLKAYLYRWSPASFILEKQDLENFADRTLSLPKTSPNRFSADGDETLEWAAPEQPGLVHLAQGRLKLRFPFQRTRVWVVSAKNRLLGIRLLGRRPFDAGFIEMLCGRYESL